MSSYYEARFKFDPKRRIVWNEIVAYLDKHIPADGTVVDLGAGYCDFINAGHSLRHKGIYPFPLETLCWSDATYISGHQVKGGVI